MSKSPTTRASLLIRLRDRQDHHAWQQFVEIYGPLIHAYGLRQGLQDADSADLVQEVLQAIAGHADRFEYDAHRGTFRGWLFTVTRNKLRTMMTRRKRKAEARGGTGMQQVLREQPDNDADVDIWNREHQVRLFSWAVERVRGEFKESTWVAFWETAVEQRAAAEVAGQLDMTPGAVYIAKSRVLARLRREIETVENE